MEFSGYVTNLKTENYSFQKVIFNEGLYFIKNFKQKCRSSISALHHRHFLKIFLNNVSTKFVLNKGESHKISKLVKSS